MVTEKDIMNMGRKIKRSNNPKTLARYQAQIDAWIAELAQDQARTQADILALEEKIKLEEEAREAQLKGDNQYTMRSGAPESPDHKDSKKIAVKIAEKAGVSPVALAEIPTGEATKKIAGPRKCYHYFEFERLHLRRSRF